MIEIYRKLSKFMTQKKWPKSTFWGGSENDVLGGQNDRFGGWKKRGYWKKSKKKLTFFSDLCDKNLGEKILGGINFLDASLSH